MYQSCQTLSELTVLEQICVGARIHTCSRCHPLEALVVRESVFLHYLAALVDRPLGLDVQGCHANAWYTSDLVEWER